MQHFSKAYFMLLLVCLAGLLVPPLMGQALLDTADNLDENSAENSVETSVENLSESLDGEHPEWSPRPKPSPVRFLTGHGLSLGRGRSSNQGLHGMDSLSLALRQYPGAGRFSEKISLTSDFNLQKSLLQTATADFSLQFRQHGLTLGTKAGITYASLVFNTLSRIEKMKVEAELVATFSASVSKAFSLDADSTWEWVLGGGYDNYGGEFKTWDGYTSLEKTWRDFAWLAQASTYQQHQSQTSTVKCKLGSAKTCSQTMDSTAVVGLGLSLFGEWDHEAHLLSVKTSLDWQFTAVSSRYRTVGVGYIYSPLLWLNLGLSALREKALDAEKGRSYWLLGSTVSLRF